MDWYELVPKVELHLHLEGAIPHAALWELVQKYGGDPETPNPATLEKKFAYRDFPHFLLVWQWVNRFLREYEDFSFIAESVARDLARQNVRYVEMFCSPSDFSPHGLQIQPLIEAIRAGLDRVPEIRVGLVPDLVRDYGPQRGAVTLEQINEVRRCGVLGIGIGGSEQFFPPDPFARVYDRARELELHTSAHAGEAAGADSLWGAIRALHVDRIGHATRAEEDPALLDYLGEQQIPLEMCPISNLRTGVVRDLSQHPVRRYFDRGLLVTVNTDDPHMFGNSLAMEYRALVKTHGFSTQLVHQVILNAVRSSWLPEPDKSRLAAELQADPGWAPAPAA